MKKVEKEVGMTKLIELTTALVFEGEPPDKDLGRIVKDETTGEYILLLDSGLKYSDVDKFLDLALYGE